MRCVSKYIPCFFMHHYGMADMIIVLLLVANHCCSTIISMSAFQFLNVSLFIL